MFVGRGLRARNGSIEPALIDPALPIDRRRPDWSGEDLFYWPSYDELTPASRAAFLTWLAGGRSHPGVPIGYVFLFFYGLERRVLLDALAGDPQATAELPAIRHEVERLDQVYGADSRSFRRYAQDFLEFVLLLQAGPAPEPPPQGGEDPWVVPLTLRLGLARLASEGRPVPVEWALSWAWFHPGIYARTPQTRCRDEFVALFETRYRAQYGEGLRLDPARPALQVSYHPASSGLLGADITLRTIPDVLEDPEPSRQLRALVDSITNDLDAYSRYIGRHPDRRDSLPASALLPADLVPAERGVAREFLSWARGALGGDASVVVNASELIGFWPTEAADKMSKREVVTCAQLLERHQIGLEPDVRVGGPALNASAPAVLFDAEHPPPRAAGAEYTAATTLLQLAIAVAAADGSVDAPEQEVLLEHLGAALDLSPGEQERLLAHLHWLIAVGPKLTGLARRLRDLPEDRRTSTASLLVAVAAADGIVTAPEIKTLEKIYKMLGLDPTQVYSTVHEHTSVGGVPVAERPRRHARAAATTTPASPAPARPERGVVDLDPVALAAAAENTATVSALLSEVFEENERTESVEPSVREDTPGEVVVPGLDFAHSGLLRTLLQRTTWARAEFDAAASAVGLLPDGALDTLNDLSHRVCDEPLFEDDGDVLELNDYARQEVLR